MKTSDVLKNFKFEKGEHTVILRPYDFDVEDAERLHTSHVRLHVMMRQIAGELAWCNPGRVLYIKTCNYDIVDMLSFMRPITSQYTEPYSAAFEDCTRRYAIAHKLSNKLALSCYEASKEDARGGLEPSIRSIIKHAGDIGAVVVEDVTSMAMSNGEDEVISECGPGADQTTVTRKRKPHTRWQYRVGEILTVLGKVAKEENLCIVSGCDSIQGEEAFSRITSLGVRSVWGWHLGASEQIDRLYGMQECQQDKPKYFWKSPWLTLVEYDVATKEVKKSDLYDDIEFRSRYVCHDLQKELDKLMDR